MAIYLQKYNIVIAKPHNTIYWREQSMQERGVNDVRSNLTPSKK